MIHHVYSRIGPGAIGLEKVKEIVAWLNARKLIKADNMTDLHWGRSHYYFRLTGNSFNPRFHSMDPDNGKADDLFLHLFFTDAKAAMLYKLTWGGE